MFFERLKNQRELNAQNQDNEDADGSENEDDDGTYGNPFNLPASQSVAHSNSLTNAINLAGIPIKNTVSGGHTASTDTGLGGKLMEQFSIGNLGITAGLNSEGIGSGFGVNRKPGEFGIHLGGLNFGFTNHAANTDTQTITTSSATGEGATSSSQSNTHSNSYTAGNGHINIQNTISSSHAHSSSLTGTTSAGVGGADSSASSATQNTQASNTGLTGPVHYNQYQPQPDVTQPQNLQQPFAEMKVAGPGYQQPGPQFGSEYQQPNFQPGINQTYTHSLDE